MTIFKPYEYQQFCIDEIIRKPRLGLFLDMGLGKTAITLSAIKELMQYRFEVNKVLIVAPKTVAQSTWQNEIAKWANFNGLTVQLVLNGGPSERTKSLEKEADIYITSRDLIERVVNVCLKDKKWPFDMVVLDESSSFKNPSTKRFRAMKKVRNISKRMLLLTGTPSPNNIGEVWSQIFLLDGGERLEKTLLAFRAKYYFSIPMNGFCKYELKPDADKFILDKIKDICVSMKATDYIELPEITYINQELVLDEHEYRKYKTLEREAILNVDSEEIAATSAAALSNKLLQLSNGAIYDEDGKSHNVHFAKIDALDELIESLNGKPVLVFYSFISDKDRILQHYGGKKRISEYKGADSLKAWNDHKLDILLCHPASTAYGLNLQEGGNYIIWYGLTWSYEQYVQANARLHRQGQRQNVFVYHLVSKGTRDEDVMKALAMKEKGQEYVLESLKARIERIKKE